MQKPKKSESKPDFLKRCTADAMTGGMSDKKAFAACNLAWNNAKNLREPLSMTVPVVVETLKEGSNGDKPRKFMLTAYTGQKIKRYYYDIIFDVKGITFEEKLPILREHMRDRIVGSGKAWKQNGTVYVNGSFANSRDGREVQALADDGIPWQASMGVWPKKVKVLRDEKEVETVNGQEITGPAEIWLESYMREVSFVTIGADNQTAGIALSEQGEAVPVEITFNSETKEEVMKIDLALLEKEAPELLTSIREAAAEAARADGVQAGVDQERGRVLAILKADGDPKVTLKAIEEGTSEQDTYKQLYQDLKAKKGKALEEMEGESTQTLGQEDNTGTESADTRPADVVLSEKAARLSQEKNIPIEKAMRQVLSDDPELAKKYREQFKVE